MPPDEQDPKWKKYLHKSVMFDSNSPEEVELWKWLKHLPYGEFSRQSKLFWKEQFEKDRAKKDSH